MKIILTAKNGRVSNNPNDPCASHAIRFCFAVMCSEFGVLEGHSYSLTTFEKRPHRRGERKVNFHTFDGYIWHWSMDNQVVINDDKIFLGNAIDKILHSMFPNRTGSLWVVVKKIS